MLARNLLLVFVLVILGNVAPAQDFWEGDPIDLRAGLNNGIRKLFLQLEAKPGEVPLLRFRSRLIDPENLPKEIFGDIVPPGGYIYQGSESVKRRGSEWVEHRFALSRDRTIRVVHDIKGIETRLLREFAKNRFDFDAEHLPDAILIMGEGAAVQTFPLRDLSAWRGREEEALVRDEVPMEKTADRREAIGYLVGTLVSGKDREERLRALEQIDRHHDDDLEVFITPFVRLRTDEDEVVAGAVKAFCLRRNYYSQQELMKCLYQFRLDDEEGWRQSLDLLDKIPEKAAFKEGTNALKHFIVQKKPGGEIAERARKKLDAYRLLAPPGLEDAPLLHVGPETGWIPVVEPIPLPGPTSRPAPESRPGEPPTSRPAEGGN